MDNKVELQNGKWNTIQVEREKSKEVRERKE
jgi:hypothetical protein